MKEKRNLIILSIIILLWFCILVLPDKYREQKLECRRDMVINDKSLQEGVFLEYPVDVTEDPNGNIYVSDFKGRYVLKYGFQGKLSKIIGREGQGPGEFGAPSFLAVSDKRLFVWDHPQSRLNIFNLEGEFIKAKGIYFVEGSPRKMKVLPDGCLVIETEKSHFFEDKLQECRIEIYSPELEKEKTLYTKDVLRNKYITEPLRTNIPMPFQPDVHWDITPEGEIVVGYSGKDEIEIYDVEKGRILTFSHSFPLEKVTAEDKEVFFQHLGFGSFGTKSRKGAPDFTKKHVYFPKLKPYFNHILVDKDGRIFVGLYKRGKEGMQSYCDVFSPEGIFLYELDLCPEINFSQIKFISRLDQSFWMIKESLSSMIEVVKYIITSE